MRVLFITYPRIGLDRGGLQIQIEKTAQVLAELGVEVLFYDPWKNQIDDVDICHFFSIDGSMAYHVRRAVERNKIIVFSPVFNAFDSSVWKVTMKVKVSEIIPGMRGGLATSKFMLRSAQRVLALNSQEQDAINNVFGISPNRCVVVPNGINKSFLSGDPTLVKKRYGVEGFVLVVGTICKRKNQLTLIKAMTRLPYRLVVVGGSDDNDYMTECKDEAGENVIFTGQLTNDDPLLASIFAEAKLFVLPSYSEVMPLTLYEAGVAGCKIIASKNYPVAKDITSFVPRIDPDDPQQLASAIKSEMETPVNREMTEIIRAMPSWRDIGSRVKYIYEELLDIKE
jgi:glycosyltransferase involved in cell wall biosynthesis